MIGKKKLIIAGALVLWILVALHLWSKTLDELRDELRSDKQPSVDPLSLKHIIFPSLRDQD